MYFGFKCYHGIVDILLILLFILIFLNGTDFSVLPPLKMISVQCYLFEIMK